MSNTYFNWPTSGSRFIPFDAATAGSMNTAFDQVSTGFDGVQAEVGAIPGFVSLITSLWLGVKASDPLTDNAGAPLVQGASYWNTTNSITRVYSGTGWVTAALPNGDFLLAQDFDALLELGISDVIGDQVQGQVTILSYDNRGTLRSAGVDTGLALVESLGLFRHVTGSTEIDDDETCFATSTGRWLLNAVSQEYIDSVRLEYLDSANIVTVRDRLDAIEDAIEGATLFGSGTSTATALASVSTLSVTITVTGAAVGDRVVVSPSVALDARLSVYARVSTANTVVVSINNPSASSAAMTNPTTWYVTVFKDF